MATGAGSAAVGRTGKRSNTRKASTAGSGEVAVAEAVDGGVGGRSGSGRSDTRDRPNVNDLRAQLYSLTEQLDQSRSEMAELKEQVSMLVAERDAALMEAEAHAGATRAVTAAMEQLVDELQAELEAVIGAARPRPAAEGAETDLLTLEQERDELTARLSEIETSRAWVALKRYRGVRSRLSQRR